MSTLAVSAAKKIARVVRLFSSDFEGERLNAFDALLRLVKAEGITFNDLATVIENHEGEIEARKYSDSDAEIIFNRGVEMGRAEEARKKELLVPANFYDEDGHPRWSAIALFCQEQNQRLRPAEQEFVDDMAGNTLWREPTEKQAKWLLSIFVRLGGRRSR